MQEECLTEQKELWLLEANFLLAYYHMVTLPTVHAHYRYITLTRPPESEYNGRMHWLCKTDLLFHLEAACRHAKTDSLLPAPETKWEEPLLSWLRPWKGRLLVYAAPPLFNGSFCQPTGDHQNLRLRDNQNPEHQPVHDWKKWVWGAACLWSYYCRRSSRNGYKLFSLEDVQSLYQQADLSCLFLSKAQQKASTADKRTKSYGVQLMRDIAVTTRYKEGNRETIWGLQLGNHDYRSFHTVIKNNQGTWKPDIPGGIAHAKYSGNFTPKTSSSWKDKTVRTRNPNGTRAQANWPQWHYRWTPAVSLCFYARIVLTAATWEAVFGGGQPWNWKCNWASRIQTPSLFNRDNCVTGYLSQKFIESLPCMDSQCRRKAGCWRPLIRMAETVSESGRMLRRSGMKFPSISAHGTLFAKTCWYQRILPPDVTDDMPTWNGYRTNALSCKIDTATATYAAGWLPRIYKFRRTPNFNAMSKFDPSFEES